MVPPRPAARALAHRQPALARGLLGLLAPRLPAGPRGHHGHHRGHHPSGGHGRPGRPGQSGAVGARAAGPAGAGVGGLLRRAASGGRSHRLELETDGRSPGRAGPAPGRALRDGSEQRSLPLLDHRHGPGPLGRGLPRAPPDRGGPAARDGAGGGILSRDGSRDGRLRTDRGRVAPVADHPGRCGLPLPLRLRRPSSGSPRRASDLGGHRLLPPADRGHRGRRPRDPGAEGTGVGRKHGRVRPG